MKPRKYEFTVERYGYEAGDKLSELAVTGLYYPPCQGSRNEFGVPMEPDDEAEVEIASVLLDEVETELSSSDREFVEGRLWELVNGGDHDRHARD